MTLKNINIHQLIGHLQFMTFQILGLAPISLDQTTPSSLKKINITTLLFLNTREIVTYNLALILIVIILHIFRTWTGQDLVINSPMVTILTGCLDQGFMWIEIIILVIYYYNRTVIKNLANRLANFHVITLNTKDGYYLKIFKYHSYFIYFIYLIIYINSAAVNHFFQGVTLNLLSADLCNFILCSIIIQYALIVNIIRDRFVALNRALIKNFMTLDKQRQFNNCQLTQNYLIVYGTNEMLVIKLIRAREILHDICQRIIEFYSLPIFLVISGISYSIIVNAYWVVVAFVSVNWPVNMILTNLSASLWLAVTLFPIIALTITITGTMDEVCRLFL